MRNIIETEAIVIKFFYCTRNIIGLILVISPLAGFLYIDFDFTLSMIFFCALAAGVPLGSLCYRLIGFRLWTGLACIAACLGALLLHGDAVSQPVGAAEAMGMAFVGLYAGGLAVVVPSNLLVSWFRASKTFLMGTVFSISAVLGALISIIMERHTYAGASLSLVIMLTGTLFFLQRPPFFINAPVLCEDKRFKDGKRAVTVKLFVFIMVVSFAAGHSLFTGELTASFDYYFPPKSLFILGIAAGPFLAGLLSEFKGIYSGCILVIFLAELSVFSLGVDRSAFQTYLGVLSQGLFLSAMTVVIPIAVYYIYGPGGYSGCLGKVWPAFPLGLAGAGALSGVSHTFVSGELLPPQAASICLMVLLVACFFTIFSTWRHRFILLK